MEKCIKKQSGLLPHPNQNLNVFRSLRVAWTEPNISYWGRGERRLAFSLLKYMVSALRLVKRFQKYQRVVANGLYIGLLYLLRPFVENSYSFYSWFFALIHIFIALIL